MAVGYRAIGWTPFKRLYDLWLVGLVAVLLAGFFFGAAASTPPGETWSEVQLLLRAFGAASFALLTLTLSIGPLARLSPRFKPFLFNRRHLGVTTFLLALAHAGLVVMWYHGFAEMNPFVSLFANNPRYDSINGFPFESLGVLALFILFLMAATSHDFYNANLGPRLWKALHMGVYVAFAAIVLHVVLGVVQGEKGAGYMLAAGGAFAFVAGLHLLVALRTWGEDARATASVEGWLRVGPAADIPENRALIVQAPGGERIAVFRYDGQVSAISNVCRHQAGPLGEGCIKDGLVTCPWHGYQYRPQDGRAPAPFTEKLPTYRVRIEAGVVFVDPAALPPGTPVPPARIPA